MKKRLYILLISILLIIPLKANATTAALYLSCPSSGAVGNTLTCSLSASTTALVSSVGAQVSLSSNLTFKSFTVKDGWQGDGNGGKITLYTDINKTGNFNIGDIVFTVNSESSSTATVTVNNVTFSDQAYNETVIGSPSKNISILSSINTLSSLSISNGTLSPAFNSNTLTYTSTVNSTSTVINATPTSTSSTVTGTGTKTLRYGENIFSINVRSASGVTKTYTLKITRPDGRDTDNNLKTLTVENTDIKFDSSKTAYTSTVENNISSITINATTRSFKASLTGTGTFELKEGINKFYVVVTAENTSKKSYGITIIRKSTENPTEFKGLESLSVGEYSVTFSPTTYDYSFDITDDISALNILYKTENEDDVVEITGNDNLKMGKNEITIKVISATGVTKTYTLTVTKKEHETMVEYDTSKILQAIEKKQENINVYINNSVKDKIIYTDIIDALIKNKWIIKYNIVDNSNNIIYSVLLDGTKLKSINDYIDIELLLETDKDKLFITFNKYEKLSNNIKITLNVEKYFKDKELYLYKNSKYIDKLSVKNNNIELNISDLSKYELSNKRLINTKLLLIEIPIILVVGAVSTFLIIKIKNKQQKQVNKVNPFRSI